MRKEKYRSDEHENENENENEEGEKTPRPGRLKKPNPNRENTQKLYILQRYVTWNPQYCIRNVETESQVRFFPAATNTKPIAAV